MAYSGSISFESLFRRCVGCDGTTPACPPSCPDGQICSLIPPTCDSCQKTVCVESATTPSTVSSSESSNSGPNKGAIAGGVVGGVAMVAIATYLVWRFCIKTRRQQYEQENWAEDSDEQLEAEKDFAMRRDARSSTHTVGSIASTVLTRASNIIQIAYIPGVTNRSTPSTPGLLVPPVPPIPMALSEASTPRYEQEHFFMPGDLRDSTYSGISDRTSYARTSVASTIYGKNAIVSPVPAQTMIRGKAAVVSVKSNANQCGELMPPVPRVDYDRFGPGRAASPAFSVGSTFLNSASTATATQVKPQLVKVVSAQKKSSPVPSIAESELSTGRGVPRDSGAITIIDDTPSMEPRSFAAASTAHQATDRNLSPVTEGASMTKMAGDAETPRIGTPFGDENEVKE
ncbi:Opy2 protein [Diplocarpon rosae]|nr:Opy2 protein [Diplocarpon rosae]